MHFSYNVVSFKAFGIIALCVIVSYHVCVIICFVLLVKLCIVIEICTSEQKWNVCLFVVRNTDVLSVTPMFYSTQVDISIVSSVVTTCARNLQFWLLQYFSVFATVLCQPIVPDHIFSGCVALLAVGSMLLCSHKSKKCLLIFETDVSHLPCCPRFLVVNDVFRFTYWWVSVTLCQLEICSLVWGPLCWSSNQLVGLHLIW